MKKIAIIISSLLFSTLFYKQAIGLNLLLFTIITIIILAINNKNSFTKRTNIVITSAYLISGITVFLYSSNLSILANILTFITLVGGISEHKSSIYVKWVNGLYSIIVSTFSLYFDALNSEVINVKKRDFNYLYWIKFIGIPTIVLIVFISLYRNGNPMFDDLISKIDLSFINLQWILLASLGCYLFYNISNPIKIDPATTIDISTGNDLTKNNLKEVPAKTLENENQLGVVLIGLLNALILFYLITEFYIVAFSHQLGAMELSQQVHSGINALIASILLAIIIIVYFFRGNLNFFEKNKAIKNLTHIWIFLNTILVLVIAYKNFHYSNNYGFTYKRIGVFVYLLLTFTGLVSTYIKVSKIKNLWFLFRVNLKIAFVILLFSSLINWDKAITIYNVEHAKNLDVQYLINLSDNNTFILKEYVDKKTLPNSYGIELKYEVYISYLNRNSWQEFVADNLKTK